MRAPLERRNFETLKPDEVVSATTDALKRIHTATAMIVENPEKAVKHFGTHTDLRALVDDIKALVYGLQIIFGPDCQQYLKGSDALGLKLGKVEAQINCFTGLSNSLEAYLAMSKLSYITPDGNYDTSHDPRSLRVRTEALQNDILNERIVPFAKKINEVAIEAGANVLGERWESMPERARVSDLARYSLFPRAQGGS